MEAKLLPLTPKASALAAPAETHTGQWGIQRSKLAGMLTGWEVGVGG